MVTKEVPNSLVKSKTVWGAVIVGIGMIAMSIGEHYGVDMAWVPEVLITFGGMVGAVGIRGLFNK